MSCAACRLISSSSRFRITSMQHPLRTVLYPELEINMRRPKKFAALPEAANDEIVPVRAVKAQHVHDRPAFGGIDDLANSQQRIAAGGCVNLRESWHGGGSGYLVFGFADVDFVYEFNESYKGGGSVV